MAITPQGDLLSLESFWRLTLEGGKASPERIAASAASAGDAEEIDAGSSSLADCDVGDRTRSDAEEDDDLDYLFFEEIIDYEEQDMGYAEDNEVPHRFLGVQSFTCFSAATAGGFQSLINESKP
jgi:hypothetical protein